MVENLSIEFSDTKIYDSSIINEELIKKDSEEAQLNTVPSNPLLKGVTNDSYI